VLGICYRITIGAYKYWGESVIWSYREVIAPG